MTASPEPPRRRRRFRLVAVTLCVIAAVALLVSCVSSQPARAGIVSDGAGRPIPDAYVLAVHWGKNYGGLVHATSFVCAGELLRTDATGRYEIDARWLFTRPLVGEIEPVVVAVYAPDHRAGVHDPQFGRFDMSLPTEVDAPSWFDAISGLRRLAMQGDGEWLDLDSDARAELHALIVREFERFLAAHGDEDRGDGIPWRRSAQDMLEWDRAHEPG
ncbi:MAG: carboxypeptidase regulatory-like domain-containing protein [Planctomycetes bacterium]|nr:carboxypeptidase regulatory-like domain-containing protein [Planctomycetota bacterium]